MGLVMGVCVCARVCVCVCLCAARTRFVMVLRVCRPGRFSAARPKAQGQGGLADEESEATRETRLVSYDVS